MTNNIQRRCRATFSSGEGFGAKGRCHEKTTIRVDDATAWVHRFVETIGCAETVLGRTHGFAPTVPRIVRCQRKLFPLCQLRIMLYAFILYTSPFRVGAHPCVRPGREAPLSCRPDFGKANDGVLSAGEQWSAHKTIVAVPFHNAAMAVISLSNVRFADRVKRHACGMPKK